MHAWPRSARSTRWALPPALPRGADDFNRHVAQRVVEHVDDCRTGLAAASERTQQPLAFGQAVQREEAVLIGHGKHGWFTSFAADHGNGGVCKRFSVAV